MTKGLLKKILMPAGIALGLIVGANSCNHNSAVQEKTSTFQGYHFDTEGKTTLVFDNAIKELREVGTEDLIVYASAVKEIKGNENADLIVYHKKKSDTLKIGNKYIIGYIPSKIESLPERFEYIKEIDSAYSN